MFSKNLLKIVVIDSGVGIDAQDQHKLFQAFGKLQQTSQANPQGVGLGLMISHILSKKLSLGQNQKEPLGLEVYSEGKNKGTSFSYYIYNHLQEEVCQIESPLKDQLRRMRQKKSFSYHQRQVGKDFKFFEFRKMDNQEQDLKPQPQNKDEIKLIIQPSLSNTDDSRLFACDCAEVLVVDDTPFNVTAFKKGVEKFNFKIDSAYNGEEAVGKMLEQYAKKCSLCRSFKIIMMDIEMPIKNGYEATKAIRSYEQSHHDVHKAYIIGCSAYGNNEKDKCIQEGMTDYLPKPVRPQKFKDKFLQVKRILFKE